MCRTESTVEEEQVSEQSASFTRPKAQTHRLVPANQPDRNIPRWPRLPWGKTRLIPSSFLKSSIPWGLDTSWPVSLSPQPSCPPRHPECVVPLLPLRAWVLTPGLKILVAVPTRGMSDAHADGA